MEWFLIFIDSFLTFLQGVFSMSNSKAVHSMNRVTFFEMLNQLENIAVGYGYARGIITAQVCLETGYGKKIIDKNLFNIKATESWIKKGGKFVNVLTSEYNEKGDIIKDPDALFRVYNSYEESLEDYVNLISKVSFYRKAWNNRGVPSLYYRYLVETGTKNRYASDPKYPDKLNRVFKELFA